MNKKYIVLSIVSALIIMGGSFYGGTLYEKSKTPFTRGNFEARMPQGGRPMGQFGGNRNIGEGFTAGEIINKDATSITVKLPNGGSKIIFLGDTIQVSKSTNGTINDLAIGTQITVTGKANSDGSVTAQSVQIRQGTF